MNRKNEILSAALVKIGGCQEANRTAELALIAREALAEAAAVEPVQQAMQYASFGCAKDAAIDWRSNHGGWIFESTTGAYIWFNNRFTPSAIIAHPVLTGLSGKLI